MWNSVEHIFFNDNACRLFIENIADVMKTGLCTKLKASRFSYHVLLIQ